MSIEIESEYSDIKIRGEKYRQTSLLEQSAVAAVIQSPLSVCDRGISYIPFVRLKTDKDEIEPEFFTSSLKSDELIRDELIQFHKDPDYEEETDSFQNRNEHDILYGGIYDRTHDGIYDGAYDDAYDSLLPYDYETDVVDALNLDEQIAAYAANSWEFVSVDGNIILFQKPKWEA